MDEQPVQLVKETRIPLPAKPGQPESVDYEYERCGNSQYLYVYRTVVVLGVKQLSVNVERRLTGQQKLNTYKGNDYVESDKVILVCDQLNTHKLASLYVAFEPATARLGSNVWKFTTPPNMEVGLISLKTNCPQ